MVKKSGSIHAFQVMEEDLKNDNVGAAGPLLLMGPEGFLTANYRDRIISRYINPAAEMLDLMRLDGDTVSTADIIYACNTFPLASEKRVIVVTGADKKLIDDEELATYVKKTPDSAVLIFISETIPKISKLYKAIKSGGKVYEFERLSRPDVKGFIKKRAKEAGFRIADSAIDAIIDASDYFSRDPEYNLYRLAGDVKRIAAYAGADGRDVIELSDAAACMGANPETDVFRLLDAVSSGNKGEAFEILENVIGTGDSMFRLLSLFTGQFEMMLGYREMKEMSKSFSEIGNTLGIKSEFRLRKAAGYADKYTSGRLAELLERLYRVEKDIKTGLYPEKLAMTMFVAEL